MRLFAAVATALVLVSALALLLTRERAPERSVRPAGITYDAKSASEGTDPHSSENRPSEGSSAGPVRVPGEDTEREWAGATRLEVEVVHHGGVPASGAQLFLVAPGGVYLDATMTDDLGRARLALSEPEAALVVKGASWRPYHQLVSSEDSFVRVELQGGAVIAGQVFISGRPGRVPVRLMVRASESEGWFHASQRTTDDGRFFFSGFPAGVSGTLTTDGVYVLESGDESLDIVAPNRDVELRLEYYPAVIGRIISRANGVPETKARVSVRTTPDGQSDWSNEPFEISGVTGPDGTFRVPLREYRYPTALEEGASSTVE